MWAVIVILFIVTILMSGCSTVAGMGQDIKGAAEWTHDKMTQPAKQEPSK